MQCHSLLLLSFGLASSAQQIYIDNVPGYSDLDSCAEPPLSTVVRDMYSGCGDGGVYTSFSCFCTASSSYMASVISTAVLSYCPGSTADASSAASIFHAYCQETASATAFTTSSSTVTPTTINVTAPVVSSSTPSSSSSTQSSSQVGSLANNQSSTPSSSQSSTQSSNQTSSQSSSPKPTSPASTGLSSGAKAAIGVTVPAVVLAVLLAVFIVMRRKSHQRKHAQKHFPEDLAPAYEKHPPSPPSPPKDAMVEVPGSTTHALEMPIEKEHNSFYVQELPGGGANEKHGKVQPVELQ